MKITVELDNGKEAIVYNDVLDLYLAVRQIKTYTDSTGVNPVREITTFSESRGGAVREIVKELTQSLTELQEYLKGLRHGGSS